MSLRGFAGVLRASSRREVPPAPRHLPCAPQPPASLCRVLPSPAPRRLPGSGLCPGALFAVSPPERHHGRSIPCTTPAARSGKALLVLKTPVREKNPLLLLRRGLAVIRGGGKKPSLLPNPVVLNLAGCPLLQGCPGQDEAFSPPTDLLPPPCTGSKPPARCTARCGGCTRPGKPTPAWIPHSPSHRGRDLADPSRGERVEAGDV